MNQKPSVLRGKPGNKLSQVDILDIEAKEMERNLKNLQERMLQQNIEDEATPKYGGSRWKSARPDKGSVTSYAKDIQEKHRKKSNTEDSGLKSHSAPRLTSQKEKVPLDFRSKDVFEWLTFAQLSDYSGSFRANEISGPLLLEITLDDLDYMGVTKLGHRKTILKSIEDLRKNKRITMNLIASHEGSRTADAYVETDVKEKETVHWSHLEPLSATQVPPRASSSSNINAADDAPDILDEAAERAAFQEAVAGWRGTGGAVKIVRESDGGAKKESDSSMWCNPFQPMSDDLDGDDGKVQGNIKATKCDTGSITEHTGKNEKKYSPKRSTAPDPRSISSNLGGSHSGEVPLYQGTLDEAAEHQEFVKAVEAWRNRGTQSVPLSGPKVGVNGTGTGTEEIPTKTSIGGASASALAMAAKIASELEDEQMEFKRRMSEQRNLLQASINRNAEMKVKEDMLADCKTYESDSSLNRGEKSLNENAHAHPRSESIRSPNANVTEGASEKMRCEDKGVAVSRTIAAPKESDSKIIPESLRSYTAVSLKQSVMGLPDFKTQQRNEAAYFVDEGSDEDA